MSQDQEGNAAGSDEAPSQRNSRPTSSAMKRHQARKAQKTPLVHSSSVKKDSRVAPIYKWEVQGNASKATEEGAEPKCFEFQVRLGPEEYEELMERRASA